MRIITGVVSGGFWLFVLYANSHVLLFAVVTLLATLALREYCTITLSPEEQSLKLGAILTSIAPVVFSYSESIVLVIIGLFLSFILQFLLVISRYTLFNNPFQTLCKLCFGSAYIGLSSAHIVLIRGLPDGQFWLFLLTIIICSSDIGAYYIGSNLGRVKLCPTISPGKTVEGFFGGLLFSSIGALLFTFVTDHSVDYIKIIFLALVLSALSVIGDLTESIMKRSYNVKDSGALLPGHGGILDRVDSILIAAPVLFYLHYFHLPVQ